jgi:hypothetical protein
MGIVFVLIFYAIALSIVAAFAAAVLGIVTSVLTKRAGLRRKFLISAAAIFPFVCVGYAGMWFFTYALINHAVFHRDPGLGDSWETPLPNGYALMMIDTTDQGTVYDPKTQGSEDSVMSRDDAVFGVRQLQVSKEHIFGARDSGYFGRIGKESKFVDSYFELNTASKSHVEFSSLEELRKRAATEGVSLNLREFQAVFGDYRTTWFDYLAGAVLLLIPATGFLVLLRWIWKVRASAPQVLAG